VTSSALLHGRYEVRRELGAGGMGVVYEALDHVRNEAVALKTLKDASRAAIARFKREFRSLADIVHHNLVALHELVATTDDCFFTMELIRGQHFHRWVRDTDHSDALQVNRLRVAMRQLAEGVAAIHRAGLLHRDLKPSNVLATTGGRIVILDFGLVVDLAEESLQSAEERPLVGTATYMSPEQGAGKPLSAASDWYSVGVMLYVALTGRAPFLGGREQILMDKQRFEPPPPQELVSDIPDDLALLCSELLRKDSERRPSGAEVLRRLGSDPTLALTSRSYSFASGSSPESLIDRKPELARLHAALELSRQGAPVIAHVRGASGMGKTRLVRTFLGGLDGSALVLPGRCYAHEDVPFKALDGPMDTLARYWAARPLAEVAGLAVERARALVQAFGALRRVDGLTDDGRGSNGAPGPHEQRCAASQALVELMVRLCDQQPVIVAIDDAQWGDVDSAVLLGALLRAADPPAMLIVIGYDGEASDSAFVSELVRHADAVDAEAATIELGPLDAEFVVAVARDELHDRPDLLVHVDAIAAHARGVPLMVEELARHVRADPSGVRAQMPIGAVLRSRLKRLPDDAVALLNAVAVRGRPLEQSVAARASGVDDPAVLSLLKAGGFVRTRISDGKRYIELYHDRLREVALELIDEDDLRDLHGRMARALASTPHPEPAALAMHYRAAGDERAAEQLLRAAEAAAMALAFHCAAAAYRAALELDPDIASQSVWVALGDVLANGGRGAEAAAAYLSAVEHASPPDVFELRRRASWQLLSSGNIDDGIDALSDVLAAVGMSMSASRSRALLSIGWARVRLHLRRFKFKKTPEREVPASVLAKVDATFAVAEGLSLADLIRSADFHQRSFVLALKAGEPRRVARALAGEAVFSSLVGLKAAPRVEALFASLRQLADDVDEPATTALVEGGIGMASFQLGQFAACYEHCGRAERILRSQCDGFHWEVAAVQLFQCFALALTGRVRDMLRRFPELMQEALEQSNLYAATSLQACLGFYVPLTVDDAELAYARVDEAMAKWTPAGYHLQHANALSSRVSIDLYRGDGPRGLERCEAEWHSLKKSLLLRGQLMRWLMWGVRARAALQSYSLGGDRSVLGVVRKTARRLARERVDYCVAESLMLRAGLAFHAGAVDRAVDLLEEAEALAEEADLVLSSISMKRVRGQLVGGDTGNQLVREADRFLREQGVRRPDRVAEIFASGFREREGQ